jgi:hypothetical protein
VRETITATVSHRPCLSEFPPRRPDPAENSDPWQVFLPSEGFKGILRIPDGCRNMGPPAEPGPTRGDNGVRRKVAGFVPGNSRLPL